MFCHQCGKEIRAGAKFCAYCGAAIPVINDMVVETSAEEAENRITSDMPMPILEANSNILDSKPEQMLNFHKRTFIGNVRLKEWETTAVISGDAITLKKTTKKLFRKAITEEITLQISDIRSVTVHTVLDYWDTLYAIIAVVLAVCVKLAFVILAPVCLFCGYGKRIDITMDNGSAYAIPVKGCSAQIEAILNICNRGKVK